MELDENTEKLMSFEVARMKLRVKDRDCIPEHAAGVSLGVQFNIQISVEEFIEFEPQTNSKSRAPRAEPKKLQELVGTLNNSNSDEGCSLGAPSGNGWRQGDEFLTVIMDITARRRDYGMGENRLPTEDFVRICMFSVEHGEEQFPNEWQLVAVNSNSFGPLACQMPNGLREESCGSSSNEYSVGLAQEGLDESRVEIKRRGIFRTAVTHVDYCSSDNCRPQNESIETKGRWDTSTPERGLPKVLPTETEEMSARRGAGKKKSHRARKIGGRTKRKMGTISSRKSEVPTEKEPNKTTTERGLSKELLTEINELLERREAGKTRSHRAEKYGGRSKRKMGSISSRRTEDPTEKERDFTGSVIRRGAATSTIRPIKLGAVKKGRKSTRKKGNSRKEHQAEEEESIAGEAISDEDIQHRNQIIKEAKETMEVADRLGIKFSKDRETVMRHMVQLELQDQV